MTECKECGREIMDKTDDNFNSDHSQIQCDHCGSWQYAYEESAVSRSELMDGLGRWLIKEDI